MTVVRYLFAAAALLFMVQCGYLRSKVSSLKADAIKQLPYDPEGAYKKFEPAAEYGAVVTLGAASKGRELFLKAIADEAVAECNRAKLEAKWFEALEKNLRVLKRGGREFDLPVEEHQVAIAEAVRQMEPRWRESLGLTAWDSMVATMGKVHSDGLIPAEPFPDFNDWLEGIRRADRRAIGLREALEVAGESLKSGVEALGLIPSSAGGAPLIGVVGQLTDSQLRAGDRAFNRGKAICNRLVETLALEGHPPELKPLYAKLSFNQAAMRVSHIADQGPEWRNVASTYIVDMLIPKGSPTVPTDQQLVIIFMNNLTGYLRAVTQMMGAEDGALPEEAPVVRAVAQWTRMRFHDATGDKRRARQAQAEFVALRNEAILDPSGAQAMGLLEAGSGMPVFLR